MNLEERIRELETVIFIVLYAVRQQPEFWRLLWDESDQRTLAHFYDRMRYRVSDDETKKS